jgi:ribosomal protein S17
MAEESGTPTLISAILMVIAVIILGLLIVFIVIVVAPTIQKFPPVTHQNRFDIAIGDTYTIDYDTRAIIQIPFFNPSEYPSLYGDLILTTSAPGSYTMLVTTTSATDKVGIMWAESFLQNTTIGDKFNQRTIPVRMYHYDFSKSPIYTCIVDRYSDCTLHMSQGNYSSGDELQIYLSGYGAGNITITRTG